MLILIFLALELEVTDKMLIRMSPLAGQLGREGYQQKSIPQTLLNPGKSDWSLFK
jgi:hypothetical protein